MAFAYSQGGGVVGVHVPLDVSGVHVGLDGVSAVHVGVEGAPALQVTVVGVSGVQISKIEA